MARAESEAYQFQPSLFAMLLLDVFDQALPIAQLKQIELFSQYRRFSSAQGIDGVRLGLSMVKAVVDRHGGRIECQSEVGRGTTFRLQFALLAE
jgi:K+-sensing histidine kinase KdpD